MSLLLRRPDTHQTDKVVAFKSQFFNFRFTLTVRRMMRNMFSICLSARPQPATFMPVDQFDGSIDCPWHGRQLIFQTKRPWPQQRWQKQRKAELLPILLRTERRKNDKYGATDIRRMQTLWSVLSWGWYHSSLKTTATTCKTNKNKLTTVYTTFIDSSLEGNQTVKLPTKLSDQPEIHPIVWWAMVRATTR